MASEPFCSESQITDGPYADGGDGTDSQSINKVSQTDVAIPANWNMVDLVQLVPFQCQEPTLTFKEFMERVMGTELDPLSIKTAGMEVAKILYDKIGRGLKRNKEELLSDLDKDINKVVDIFDEDYINIIAKVLLDDLQKRGRMDTSSYKAIEETLNIGACDPEIEIH